MDLAQKEYEVSLEFEEYKLEFRGAVVPLDEHPHAVGEDGALVTWASGALFSIRDGSLCNRKTGDWANLEPGIYQLDELGFYKLEEYAEHGEAA